MKEKKNNQISVLLMIVGVLFILVAGSIFVTTAWQYLPETAKQCCLLLAAGGLFAGAYRVEKTGRLKKTECVLYDLGTAFAGFFTIAVSGGILAGHVAAGRANAWKYLAAILVMLALMGARWYRKNGVQDFVITVLLTDGMISCISALTGYNVQILSLIMAVVVLGHAALDYYRVQQGRADQPMTIAIGISYLLHGLRSIALLLWLYARMDDNAPCVVTVNAAILLAAASLTYAARKGRGYRILQSVCILGVTWAVTAEISEFMPRIDNDGLLLFLLFLVNLILMVSLKRVELFVIHLVFAELMLLAQSTFLMIGSTPQWEEVLPYSLVFAVFGMYLWTVDNRSFYLRSSVLQLAAGLFQAAMVVYAYAADGLALLIWSAVLLIWGGVIWLTIAEAIPERTQTAHAAKQVCETIAMCHGLLGVMRLVPRLTGLPQNYRAEWNCAVFGIGIVLLGHIWYDKKQSVEKIRFIVTCLLLAALLLADADHGGLGNVLIYGVTTVVIILVAAVRNRRDYVIAASVALALLVLYITRAFWLSIAWWVYLFAAGVLLIVLAIKKEKES